MNWTTIQKSVKCLLVMAISSTNRLISLLTRENFGTCVQEGRCFEHVPSHPYSCEDVTGDEYTSEGFLSFRWCRVNRSVYLLCDPSASEHCFVVVVVVVSVLFCVSSLRTAVLIGSCT